MAELRGARRRVRLTVGFFLVWGTVAPAPEDPWIALASAAASFVGAALIAQAVYPAGGSDG